MLLLLGITFAALVSAALSFIVAGYMDEWLDNRRAWLIQHGASEYSNNVSEEAKRSGLAFLQYVLNDSELDRETRFRFVSGFARRNYKVLAEVFEDMIQNKENDKVVQFLSTHLRDMGVRPVIHTALQEFFSYLNSQRLETFIPIRPTPTSTRPANQRQALIAVLRKFYQHIKRVVDLILSLMFIIVLSPVLGIVYVRLWWDSREIVIRKTKHMGLNAKPFDLYTFAVLPLYPHKIYANQEKLMRAVSSSFDQFDQDYYFSTAIRRFLIRWHLDKLPQLFNVVKGDMSLIGTRPTPLHELPSLTTEELFQLAERLSVRPGMISKAQLQAYANYHFTWEEAILLDMEYIKNFSPQLDIQILFQAIQAYKRNIRSSLRIKKSWYVRRLPHVIQRL